ncbi:hypothetical protein [Salipiger marinus]|uniref:Uncharacterized protein n=1 Tax=Salipiger marinus TaxID=555512 RepID=A0A1G8U7R9_9RHOB|nr:hypothetical protein [Salipiger marinus]SDJ49856.1 hypothetical protein SAMN04487993_103712 [Salipiger marinus]
MKEPESLPPEEQSALDAWESGQGARISDRSDPASRALLSRFLAHPELTALAALTDTAHSDDTEESYTIPAARGLIRLLEHIERLDAAAAGRSPATTPALLARIIDNYLQGLLHGLATDPTAHPHYARLWNRFCAEAGEPGAAIPDKHPPAVPQEESGPF